MRSRFNPNRAAEFAATARRLAHERAHARHTIPRLLSVNAPSEWPRLLDDPLVQTCAAVDRLCEIASTELTREPKYAESVARLAVELSERLPSDYPAVILAQTRGHAWKDLAKTLSFLGQNDDAFPAFSRAEELLEPFPALQYDNAIVRLNLSIAYQETGRFTEALALLKETADVFRSYRDTRLFTIAGFYEGLLLQRMHRYREARETHLLVIASSTEIDKETLAALHNAIGFSSLELNDFTAAEDNLTKAIALYTEIRQPIEAVKGELGRGRLLIRRGLYAQGIAYLRPVRHRFLKHSLAEEAGICGLDMVEGMLQLGKTTDAENLARTIMNEFLAASLNARAITALGYLSEAIASRKASPRMATGIREYVLSLRTTPEREFVITEFAD
ncbi:MAG TPA: tetratricopeptide repeat protein [Rubrobacter sp.]|nr:tetratricopeptide repeat protein [Rubrobacter sp.]